MARTVTLSSLRTWARQLADVECHPTSAHAELTALANRHLTEVYDALVNAGPPEYYASSTTVTTVAGTTLYALPADFRTLLDVYSHESDTDLRLIHPVGNWQRGRYVAPTGVWTCTVEYVPTASALVADGDTFDGVSGWEELIANMMARDVMVKREADPSIVINTIDRMQARISTRARSRDRGHPKYTTDADAQAIHFPWGSSTGSRIDAYRLRGDNIELYEPRGGVF
jgi:hypothetical protein